METGSQAIAVVGGGYMGGGIAQVFALAGHAVQIADRDAETAEASVARLQAGQFEELGLMPVGAAATITAHLAASPSIEDAVAGAEYVVEAVPENIELKHATLRRISAALRPDAVIGSNTSALPIETLSPAVSDPTRFLGVHWFNPAPFVPGVELIPSSQTSEATLVFAEQLITSIGKETARVSDPPGFVGNRLQFALFKEAVAILEEGTATQEQIDTVVRNTFGFRLSLFGPFAIGDMAGLDVYRAALGTLHEAYGERFAVPESLDRLVQEGHVSGWDDPRMPTIAGMRRRGYTPEAIRGSGNMVGVAKSNSTVECEMLEHAIRQDLNARAERRLAVLRPLKIVIENYPQGQTEELEAVNNPEDESAGTRLIPFSRELYIERDDFMEAPAKKFFRLAPGQEVRFRWAYFLKCTGVDKDAAGNVTAVRCTYDPATRGGDAPDGRKVKGTIHWVSAAHAVKAEVRLFDRLFTAEEPGKRTGNFMDDLNPHSLEKVTGMLEPALAHCKIGDRVQFERLGYFCVDPDSKAGAMVWNRTVTLKDTWAKVAGRE